MSFFSPPPQAVSSLAWIHLYGFMPLSQQWRLHLRSASGFLVIPFIGLFLLLIFGFSWFLVVPIFVFFLFFLFSFFLSVACICNALLVRVLMSLFSIYCGSIYYEFFSVAFCIFDVSAYTCQYSSCRCLLFVSTYYNFLCLLSIFCSITQIHNALLVGVLCCPLLILVGIRIGGFKPYFVSNMI